MTTRPTRRRTMRHPFGIPSAPISVSGWNICAPDVFSEQSMVDHLDLNAEWLQAHPRSSNAIESALLPEYSLSGMEHEDVRSLMNAALWDAGYVPDQEDTDNPHWHWIEVWSA